MAISRPFAINRILLAQLAAAVAILAATPVSAAQRGTISPRCAAHLDASM